MQTDSDYDALEESAKGKRSALKVMDEFCDIGIAFRHQTLGHISLLYGDREKGIRHILSRREREIIDNPNLAGQAPRDVVLKLIDVIVFGKMSRSGIKYIVEYDGYRAILGSPSGNQLNYWLLSGYKLH